jgi:drug/metabolite transporter (DMT)-like permease
MHAAPGETAPAAIAFALASFLFAGVNDLVFKRYALGGTRSRGMLVLGIGVVWSALQLATSALRGEAIALDPVTLGYGAAAGALLVVSNLLLLESFAHVDLSLGSTIYRLNTVGVVALSWLLLDERIGAAKAGGVGLGVGAVLLLSHRPARHAHGREGLFVLAVVLASLLRAGYGVTTRQAMLSQASRPTLLLLVSASWILGGALYAALRERRLQLTREKAIYSAVSGTLVFVIVSTLLLAVERGEASVVIPIANMSFVVALAASLLTGMERLTPRKGLAVGFAAGAIVLLARA